MIDPYKPNERSMRIDEPLLNCPFCDGLAEYKITTIGRKYTVNLTLYGVECRECSANVGMFETKEEATAEWNRRVSG